MAGHRRAVLAVAFFALWTGQSALGQTGPLAWTRVTEHAAWRPRDSSGEVVFQGKMWLLGGWFSSKIPCPRDVWCSADGVTWDLVTAEAPWVHGDLPTRLVHDNRMWVAAGNPWPAVNDVWNIEIPEDRLE